MSGTRKSRPAFAARAAAGRPIDCYPQCQGHTNGNWQGGDNRQEKHGAAQGTQSIQNVLGDQWETSAIHVSVNPEIMLSDNPGRPLGHA